MSGIHEPDDDCVRLHPEQELNVVGFPHPVIAADLQAGDYFQDPALLHRWYLVRGVEEPDCDRWTHLQLDDADEQELAEARASRNHTCG